MLVTNCNQPLYKELKNLRVTNSNLQISPKTRTLYLWTKRGASRHCKMLGTDKNSSVFRP